MKMFFEKGKSLTAGEMDSLRPQGTLNYILYDEQMNIVPTASGSIQVNGEGEWSIIGTDGEITIPVNGYLVIYLGNRSFHEVYFDNLLIKMRKGKLLEETHYYPHGLPMGMMGTSSVTTVENRHKHQGNEYKKELGLNWMDFGFRQYDPQIGRFMGVDPLADYYGQDRYSPYAAMGNQPESMIDPNGLKYESTYQGVHHYSTYFVDDGGYYKKSYGEKTMMDMRIEGIEGHIFNFIGSLGGASFSSEMQTQSNNNAFWNYMMNIYLKSEGNFSLKAENNMLKLSFQTSWSENRVVVIQLNTFYIDLSSFGKSDYNNNLQQNGGEGLLESIWNGPIGRGLVPDKLSISLGGDIAAVFGVGAYPINISILTRGKDPGIYITPSLNVNLGVGAFGSSGIDFSSSYYTGNPREITSSMLQGDTYGMMVNGGFLGDVSIGFSYSPTNKIGDQGFMNRSTGLGGGFGFFIGGQYQNTPGYGSIWQWKK